MLLFKLWQVLSDINHTWYFGSEHREFLPEALILESLLAHPCRLPKHPTARLLGDDLKPHFYVIPVAWRAISLGSQPAAFRARAVELMRTVVDSATFKHVPERHLLFHTSTAATSELWGELAPLLIDPRIIVLHLEGENGDNTRIFSDDGSCALMLTSPLSSQATFDQASTVRG